MLVHCFVISIALSSRIVLGQTDTSVNLPFSNMWQRALNLSECAGNLCQPHELTMNGHHNYNAAQQIFYIYGPLAWKRPTDSEVNDKFNAREDYTVTPGVGIHKLHPRHVKWNQARKICIEEGGHLAIVNSMQEEKVLINMLGGKNDRAWVGAHDMFEEGDWTTVLDQPLASTGYAKWTTLYTTTPDNYKGIQHCATLLQVEGMDDTMCDNSHAFFCELPMKYEL